MAINAPASPVCIFLRAGLSIVCWSQDWSLEWYAHCTNKLGEEDIAHHTPNSDKVKWVIKTQQTCTVSFFWVGNSQIGSAIFWPTYLNCELVPSLRS